MAQEKKYAAVKALLEAGGISRIAEIFDYVSKTNIYKHLGVGYLTFLKKLDHPGLFTIEELITLADLIGVEDELLHTLARKEAKTGKKKRKK
ncbi:hypothetical protein [Chitinophaga nivalis]|uniref:Transcriptional regulator n=1 Tax=Chitinophaga nivalis TaxID=2991709 RepID=A0ABT3IX09_9BACT|nr:hypothetical protein [Chitinophaga nivalis]MCW3462064.1 hypothetical protein [Chitinophaga nivalis]MCW3488244.1 hypothetical protein [Chitinophaga nivalis]